MLQQSMVSKMVAPAWQFSSWQAEVVHRRHTAIGACSNSFHVDTAALSEAADLAQVLPLLYYSCHHLSLLVTCSIPVKLHHPTNLVIANLQAVGFKLPFVGLLFAIFAAGHCNINHN